MRPLSLLLILSISLLFISANSHSNNSCEKQLNKLNKIQIKQRQGHSVKRSRTLSEQERNASKQLWECKKFPTKKVTKRKKSKKKTTNRTSPSSIKKYKPVSKTPMLISSGAISVKEKYQGKKKYAWLNYYQQPDECKRPKKLSVFASCTEDRQAQQLKFEQNY